MTNETQQAVSELKQRITDAIDEIEDPEDVDAARTVVAEIQRDYSALLAGLAPDERVEVQRSLGLSLEKLKGLASRLR